MSLAVLLSRSLLGLDAPTVRVEVHLARGLPSFCIVGLADAEVRESRERVRAAIQSSGFEFPLGRLTVNLSPADIPKESGRFDLPIALGVLLVSGQIATPERREGENVQDRTALLAQLVLAGELSLTGALVSTKGALAIALSVARAQPEATLLLPLEDAVDAARVPGVMVLGARTLSEVVGHLEGTCPLLATGAPESVELAPRHFCLSELRGQFIARRALELAAAGGHSMLLSGTPGVGKSMLAKRLPGILPFLTQAQSLEVASIATFAGVARPLSVIRPFRAPHHTASVAAMIGGGIKPKPGEVSLAHHGVLFLDELPEFDRKVREALREPLENYEIAVARAKLKVVYPADFQLLATMNPCPCGWSGHPRRVCRCRPEQVLNYQSRVSGPLMDRIDLHMHMTQEKEIWMDLPPGETSLQVRARVDQAWVLQHARQGGLNARLGDGHLDLFCPIDTEAKKLLNCLIAKYDLTARAIQRVRRVARTIADLDACVVIKAQHFAEAFQYRFKSL